jgi:hypothetical protein
MDKFHRRLKYVHNRFWNHIKYYLKSQSGNENLTVYFDKMSSPAAIHAQAKNCLTFFAIGDFGVPNADIQKTAKAMDAWARVHGTPDLILGLGDNFYPYGVESTADRLFKDAWSNIFLKYTTLRVPWKMVLGNHDYMGNPDAQVEFHYDKKYNPTGLWQMPSKNYMFECQVSNQVHGSNASSNASGKSNQSNLSNNAKSESLKPKGAAPNTAKAKESTNMQSRSIMSSFSPAALKNQLFPPQAQPKSEPDAATSDAKSGIAPELVSIKESSSDNSAKQTESQSTKEAHRDFKVEFFALDTNGCQFHVARVHPETPEALHTCIKELGTNLQHSTARWKIVFGHHPLYTQGKEHGKIARALRQDASKSSSSSGAVHKKPRAEYGLENVLRNGGVQAYFAAHEHVFQVSNYTLMLHDFIDVYVCICNCFFLSCFVVVLLYSASIIQGVVQPARQVVAAVRFQQSIPLYAAPPVLRSGRARACTAVGTTRGCNSTG